MKRTYSIKIEPSIVSRQGLQNIESFLSELSTLKDVHVSDQKLEFVCDSEKEEMITQIAEKYAIVNLIGIFTNENR